MSQWVVLAARAMLPATNNVVLIEKSALSDKCYLVHHLGDFQG